MTQEAFADKRLLGALDYIDERFIAEVTEDYETFEVPGVYKPNKRAHRRAYRQFAAMAACLILLTSAFPVVGKYLAGKGVNLGGWGGNAGAGTAESEVIDTGFDKYLDTFAEMTADEIYAEVLKGGWIVQDSDFSSVFDAGEDIWQKFLLSVDNKKPTTVLLADFTSDSYVDLSNICYDGETFTITRQRRDQTSVLKTETKEFKYFKRSRNVHLPHYFFTNNIDADPIYFAYNDIDITRDMDVFFVGIWSE